MLFNRRLGFTVKGEPVIIAYEKSDHTKEILVQKSYLLHIADGIGGWK